MTDLTPQEKYDLGTKYKRFGILVAVVGVLVSTTIGGSLWCHGRTLQIQGITDARALGHGTLTIHDSKGRVIHQDGHPVEPAPLGGNADGTGKAK
jgi:hypothetical protein